MTVSLKYSFSFSLANSHHEGRFFALGFFLTSAFAVTFAAFFMGIILRVVKNVIEQATVIKSENDFTI